MTLGFVHESQRAKSVEWYTPAWVFEALAVQFDLDPCHPHDRVIPWIPAQNRYTVFDNGLAKPWAGRVWLNPPYSKWTKEWMLRMAGHGNGIAMVFSRTDASWFQEAIRTADAVLFVNGRVNFVPGRENEGKPSRSGAGTVMFAWGADNAIALRRLADRGYYLILQPQTRVQPRAFGALAA